MVLATPDLSEVPKRVLTRSLPTETAPPPPPAAPAPPPPAAPPPVHRATPEPTNVTELLRTLSQQQAPPPPPLPPPVRDASTQTGLQADTEEFWASLCSYEGWLRFTAGRQYLNDAFVSQIDQY